MKVTPVKIKIRDIVEGFYDNDENGARGYGGRLDIRPPYQRAYIYNDKDRDAVVDTVMRGLPLNTMYWAVNGDHFEVMDGQQRTISICMYVKGDFSYKERCFHNLTQNEQNKILDYELDVNQCEGNDEEKLAWFRIINKEGHKLTDQELRNVTYQGPWLADAKKRFSARGCPAEREFSEYLKGTQIRQDYLEAALKWVADRDGITIEKYMSRHQQDEQANDLWNYFKAVVEWTKSMFPVYRKEMKGIQWGVLYNKYGKQFPDAAGMEQRIKSLMMDDDVTNKKGVYIYVLSNEEKHLNIRQFTEQMKREAYERQSGVCPHCVNQGREKTKFEFNEMEADHVTPWSLGGKTNAENCVMLCKEHNRTKGGR